MKNETAFHRNAPIYSVVVRFGRHRFLDRIYKMKQNLFKMPHHRLYVRTLVDVSMAEV
ncbi:MAG: hypothetical protein WCU80_09305 [Paludibacteraceae bacterium]